MSLIREFLRDESGPTAVEYAVMLGAILMAVIAVVATLGTETHDLMESSKNEISGALSSGS